MAEALSVDHTPEANHATALNTRSLQSALDSLQRQPFLPPTSPQTVYIVTDTCYPTTDDFDTNKGNFRIDSVHSTRKSANARAKKIIFSGGQCKVDPDQIIEEVTKRGLYTGIGTGGKGDGEGGTCYARKCGVESKIVDEDSEDEDLSCSQEEREDEEREDKDLSCGQEEREAGSTTNASEGDADGDVRMG